MSHIDGYLIYNEGTSCIPGSNITHLSLSYYEDKIVRKKLVEQNSEKPINQIFKDKTVENIESSELEKVDKEKEEVIIKKGLEIKVTDITGLETIIKLENPYIKKKNIHLLSKMWFHEGAIHNIFEVCKRYLYIDKCFINDGSR